MMTRNRDGLKSLRAEGSRLPAMRMMTWIQRTQNQGRATGTLHLLVLDHAWMDACSNCSLNVHSDRLPCMLSCMLVRGLGRSVLSRRNGFCWPFLRRVGSFWARCGPSVAGFQLGRLRFLGPFLPCVDLGINTPGRLRATERPPHKPQQRIAASCGLHCLAEFVCWLWPTHG